ncbi:prepilin-type N-terminal cleavage/methylation domain-containing protein [Halomonas sp. TRM85114]|uniref:PilW family protein n=1 Tax=Halomonas jincaotanensis TaxID=2810616 RepID=UPI001BD29A0D|nr:prepilin-type N-terminal cleavage/methylation domain-containing protein [Halomonas jincaotanensis]MBS9404897.1 prepilin-type N-terminal cleavage/methylation domain-containing protein [Halomonas jincaotanensis]
MMMKRNSGFSLIELMVAMVIGLIIILGAGQLFLTVFQTNRQVETLSEKQTAVNFAVDILLRDIRRAKWDETIPSSGSSYDLTLVVTNRGDCASIDPGDDVDKTYSLGGRTLADGDTEYYLQLDSNCTTGAQELVGGFINNGFEVTAEGDYGLLVTFSLVPTDGSGTADILEFFAVNRTAAVTN